MTARPCDRVLTGPVVTTLAVRVIDDSSTFTPSRHHALHAKISKLGAAS